MPRRGGWKTVLKYAAGLIALSVSVAAAWFLPGVYAGWQDGRTEGRVVLTPREELQFLDTASLDIAGRLQMLEKTEFFQWEWGFNFIDSESTGGTPGNEETIGRCRSELEKWCRAGLFPEGCLAGIVPENLLLIDTAIVALDHATLPVYCLRFWDMDGYVVTAVMDAGMRILYYVSVCGPSMLDVIAEDLGYESFGAMAEYELQLLEERGIDPEEDPAMVNKAFGLLTQEEMQAHPADESVYDFASVCGAQEMKVSRIEEGLELDAELSFETFTGHAYRLLIAENYNQEYSMELGVGFAAMYGTLGWVDLASDFAAMYGLTMEVSGDVEEWYYLGLGWAARDPEVINGLNYYQEKLPKTEAQQAAGGTENGAAAEAYDGGMDAGVGNTVVQSGAVYDAAGG